jgi:DNA-binding transcriptional regulator YiaG
MSTQANISLNDLSQGTGVTPIENSTRYDMLPDLDNTGYFYSNLIKRFSTFGIFVLGTAGILTTLSLGTASVPTDYLSWEEDVAQSVQYTKTAEFLQFEDQTAYKQIEQIRRSLGVNILELAAILGVSRPTIYEWIESKKISIRKDNQKRLNAICEISKTWRDKNIGVLVSYLHKSFGASSKSLFDLLKNDKLDMVSINNYLENIAQIISKKRLADEAQEELLKKHGFESVSKKDMEDRLNDIDFWD